MQFLLYFRHDISTTWWFPSGIIKIDDIKVRINEWYMKMINLIISDATCCKSVSLPLWRSEAKYHYIIQQFCIIWRQAILRCLLVPQWSFTSMKCLKWHCQQILTCPCGKAIWGGISYHRVFYAQTHLPWWGKKRKESIAPPSDNPVRNKRCLGVIRNVGNSERNNIVGWGMGWVKRARYGAKQETPCFLMDGIESLMNEWLIFKNL